MQALRTATVVAALAAAAVPIGCDSGAAERSAEPVDTTRVEMALHYRFDPAVIRVQPGDTVVWTNADDFTHSVRLADGDEAPLVARPGDTVRMVFEDPGEHEYICTLHPHDMRGTVVVDTAASRT